jgi:hypothetical protein
MTPNLTRLACFALLCIAATAPCRADSLASSASSAGSASVGSLSESIRGSSNSSTRNTAQVTEGDYRIVEMAELADRPGMLRLKLQTTASPGEGGEFFLDLPQRAMAQRSLAPRDIVSVRHRPYGLEFAYADTREAFFLVLADDWKRGLDAHAVTL